MIGHTFRMLTGKSPMQKRLKQHFGMLPVEEIATTARRLPLASRVDVQLAVDQFFASHGRSTLLGIHSAIGHETLTLAHLFTRGPFPVDTAVMTRKTDQILDKRFTSSAQPNTTTICLETAVSGASSLIIRNRWPSAVTS
jgi:hypothetical protein